MTSVTNIRLRVLPRFPANIQGTNGITVVREGAGLIVKPDYGAVAESSNIPDPNETLFLAWNRQTNSYTSIAFQSMFDNSGNAAGFQTIAAAELASISPAVHAIELYGDAAVGDGLGGLYIDTDNGSTDTFVSGDGRTWYRAEDVGTTRLVDGAVETAKIADLNITTGKLADGAATNVKLADMATATIKGRATAGTGDPEDLTASQTINILDPNSQVLQGTGLKLTYHKARAAWHVKAFGSTLTEVGTGSTSADMTALQAAMNVEEAIDITGTQLRVDGTITCDVGSKTIGASQMSYRPGGDAGSDSGILIMDDTLPLVFMITGINFESSGFYVRGAVSPNINTTAFWFERPTGGPRDIDCRVSRMGLNLLGRGIYHKGRGLEVDGCLFSDIRGRSAIDLDQPNDGDYTPTGSLSIDGPITGTRGYRFYDNRYHAAYAPFVRNDLANAQKIQGIQVNGLTADVGVVDGAFKGVFIGLQANDIQCRFGLDNASRMIEFEPGSQDCMITNFYAVGFVGASGNRLGNHHVRMTSSLALPVKDIHFVGGTFGPTDMASVVLQGDGEFDVSFTDVTWKGTGQDNGVRSPIQVAATVPSSVIRLNGVRGRANVPATLQPFVRHLNTPANNTLLRDVTSTIDATFNSWAVPGVVIKTNEYVDGSVGAPAFSFDADPDTGFYRIGSGIVGYSANGVEVARWLAGAFLLGRTSTSSTPSGVGIRQQSVAPFHSTYGSGTGATTHFSFFNDALNTPVAVGSISTTGSATAFNTSSDERKKEDFLPIWPDLIDSVFVYNFAWKSDGLRGYGVKAQELAKSVPTAVTYIKKDDEWAVDYSKLVPLLVASVKDLRDRVTVLEKDE